MTSTIAIFITSFYCHYITLQLFSYITRWGLLVFTSPNPYIVPDEILYTNLARAIANNMPMNVHGQPVTFFSVLYPLIIAPVYLLKLGFDVFGAIQNINVILMNLAVFPVYFLAGRFTNKKILCIATAAFALVLPDFYLTSRAMGEALIYPLMLLALLLAVRLLEAPTLIRVCPMLVCGVSLYLAKEGNLAFIAAAVAALVWRGCTLKQQPAAKQPIEAMPYSAKRYFQAAAAVAIFSVVVIVVYRFIFAPWALGINIVTPTIYQTQYPGFSVFHIFQTMGGLLLYLLFLPVGFGLFPLILPLGGAHRFDAPGQNLLFLATAAIVAQAIGVCYLIFSHEMYDSIYHSRIHLRYFFYFVPVFFGAFISPKLQGLRINKWLVAMLSLWVTLLLTLGLYAYTSGSRFPVDSALLSFLDLPNPLVNVRVIAQIAFLLAVAYVLFCLCTKGWKKRNTLVCVAMVTLQMLVGNISLYSTDSYQPDIQMKSDSLQVAQWLQGTNTLLVSEENDGHFDNALNIVDVALGTAAPVASLEDIMPQMGQQQLTIPPYWVAGAGNAVANPEYILMKSTALYKILPREGLEMRTTDAGKFVLLRMPEDNVWLHSGISGLKHGQTITEDTRVWIFDAAIVQSQEIVLQVDVSCEQGGYLTLQCNGQQQTYYVQGSSGLYEFRFAASGEPLAVEVSTDANMYLTTYTVQGISGCPVIN